MKLEDIGFYTLTDKRAAQSSSTSSLKRCELILTGRCNFRCPYCRHIGGADLNILDAWDIITLWAKDGLENIRFSGGEPTLYVGLGLLIQHTKSLGVKRIAISTNGSASISLYRDLIDFGVNDISISLDACCAEDGDKMSGGIKGAWRAVVDNLKQLSKLTYVTVGIVLTAENESRVNETIQLAHNCGVADIRIIPAAQDGNKLPALQLPKDIANAHPILKYRAANIDTKKPFRGIRKDDAQYCGLVLDDMAVMNNQHYPCIIYLRENGKPIGAVGPNMRAERQEWYEQHDTHTDPICSKNCLDVCVAYNNRFAEFHC